MKSPEAASTAAVSTMVIRLTFHRRERPNLKVLASALGLSVTTVSRALRDGEEVRPETIARVKKAASELGYVRDLGGVKLRTGLSYTISVLMVAPPPGDVADTGTLAIMRGLHEPLEAAGYSITAVPMAPQDDPVAALRRVIDGRQADGVVIDHTEPQDARVRFLLENDIPFVCFGRTELYTPHPWFDVDNEAAAELATGHLARQGFRRIALINPEPRFLFALQRRRGYRRALEASGLDADPALVREIPLTAGAARETALAMLRGAAPPDAFVAANETVTLGITAALRDAGPAGRGVGLVSRDGTDLTRYLETPPPRVHYSLAEAGRRLAGILLGRIAGRPVGDLQELVQAELQLP